MNPGYIAALLVVVLPFLGRAQDPATRNVVVVTIDGMLLDPVAVLQASLEGYVRFVVLDDDGVPIRWGRERRLFQGAARDAVMMLAPHCTHPGCRVPTSRSQADHLQPWAHGGATNPDNGGPQCSRHNRWRNNGYRSKRWRHMWHTYRPDGTQIC